MIWRAKSSGNRDGAPAILCPQARNLSGRSGARKRSRDHGPPQTAAGRERPALREEFRRDVLAGLARPLKTVPCKYLYDRTGARLFEEICELQEYYPTRTELSILRENIGQIAALIGPRTALVDLGSGDGRKSRLLLDHLPQISAYVPVDVARAQLREYAQHVRHEHADLEVHPLCADYTRGLELPLLPSDCSSMTIFFPGSTIGNFEPNEAEHFLHKILGLCGESGGALIGVDLKKSSRMLHRAYNDSRGLTARFNLNLLTRINRELGGAFNLSHFAHRAFYAEDPGRVEMHLVSRCRQSVPLDGESFDFVRGEPVVTEHSYKYSVGEFQELAARAGFEPVRCWTDDRHWFSVHFLRPAKCRPRADGACSADL